MGVNSDLVRKICGDLVLLYASECQTLPSANSLLTSPCVGAFILACGLSGVIKFLN